MCKFGFLNDSMKVTSFIFQLKEREWSLITTVVAFLLEHIVYWCPWEGRCQCLREVSDTSCIAVTAAWTTLCSGVLNSLLRYLKTYPRLLGEDYDRGQQLRRQAVGGWCSCALERSNPSSYGHCLPFQCTPLTENIRSVKKDKSICSKSYLGLFFSKLSLQSVKGTCWS